jgi:hypothetical protein
LDLDPDKGNGTLASTVTNWFRMNLHMMKALCTEVWCVNVCLEVAGIMRVVFVPNPTKNISRRLPRSLFRSTCKSFVEVDYDLQRHHL